MQTSQDIDQLATALAAAKLEIPKTIPKNGRGNYGTYTKLDDLLEAIRDPLAKNGLTLIQAGGWENGRVSILSRLLHKSGQWIETLLTLKPNADTPQQIGGAITYGKKYQGAAMLGISAHDDDDGQGSSSEEPKKLQKPQQQKIVSQQSDEDWLK